MTLFVICRFDSAEHLTGKKRTYATVKAAVLEAGRFSTFEATASDKAARLFTKLCRDPEIEVFDMPFPWTGVRRRTETDPTPNSAEGSDHRKELDHA